MKIKIEFEFPDKGTDKFYHADGSISPTIVQIFTDEIAHQLRKTLCNGNSFAYIVSQIDDSIQGTINIKRKQPRQKTPLTVQEFSKRMRACIPNNTN